MANEDDNEAHVTLEDQKKINLFARKNATLNELKLEIEEVKKSLQNIEDASDDLILLDEEDSKAIPYQLGEVFIQYSLDETQELLEKAKLDYENEIKTLENQTTEIQATMKELKVQLYAKFGTAINLEA